jgi:hypothetical protein
MELKCSMTTKDVAVRLQNLYHKNDIARAVFEDAAERRYIVAKPSVDRTARIAGRSIGDILALRKTCRKLSAHRR